MKKILLCTFMLCCCISSLFAQMWTDENGVGWDFQANGNEATITRAYNFGTEVVVPEKVFMESTDENGNPFTQEYTITGFGNGKNVFGNGKGNISKVILPSTIKTIGYYAFYNCGAMTFVGDLSVCTSIGDQAFFGCYSLTSVGDLSACTSIGESAFENCSALTSVGDLSACTTIGDYAFENCSALTSVGDLSACTSFGMYAFYCCSALTSVGDLSACTTIGDYAFRGCYSLTSVGDLSACSTIGTYAFYNCDALTSVGDLSVCTSIGKWAFENCSALTSVGDLSACKSIGSAAFRSCSSLTSVGDLSACTTIGNQAFIDCSSLTSIGDLSACTTIGSHAFGGCSSLTSIGALSACKSIGSSAFSGCDILKSITLPATPPTSGGASTVGKYRMIGVPEQEIDTDKADDIWSDMKNRIISITDQIDYVVTNTALNTGTPGLAKEIADEDLLKVVTLKVSGTINSYDIIAMNNWMPNLHWLDLTDATIEACDYEYYTGEKTTDNVIGNRMFYNQDEYVSIKLPKNVVSIGNFAFNDCSNLKEVVMHQGIISIGRYAFSGSSISEIVIPEGCESIGDNAFEHCGLKTVVFPTTLKSIDDYAFQHCSRLTKIILPQQLKSIGRSAFSDCSNLEELKIPSSVVSIGNYAFDGCNKLKDVYTYTLEPTNIIQETFSTYPTATLYVPTTSRGIYRINTEWSQFLQIEEFDEEYEYFYINKDYVLDDQTGVVGGKPDGDLNPGSGFIQEGTEDQEMGDIHMKDDGNTSSSLIGNGNINADNLFFDMTIEGGRWYFFCFPFKVYLSDITCPGQHVWRKYDGAKRAEKGEGGWVDLDADEVHLKKGYGYIFQASQSGTLTLKVTKEQFGKFENADHHHVVEEHPAEDENNASWNFMGNPHTSYYGIGEMGYDAPITIWTGTTYEAVRPGDDDYYLKPFQAFFVQKPEGTDEIAFDGDSRMTYLQSEQAKKEAKARRLARGINPDRLLVNLTLSDGTHTDKTRVVFNDKQSMGYEMACDAAKFMSTEGTPQLYTLDNKHIRYAINERPNGDVTMGYSVSKEGTYTISAARMDKPMVLRDLEMGITFDLSNGDYTFTSKAGTNEKRFVLSANQSETGIADIMKETGVNIMAVEGGIHISGLNGQTVYIYDLSGAAIATQTTDDTAVVKAGTYVIKVDNLSTKLLVK